MGEEKKREGVWDGQRERLSICFSITPNTSISVCLHIDNIFFQHKIIASREQT